MFRRIGMLKLSIGISIVFCVTLMLHGFSEIQTYVPKEQKSIESKGKVRIKVAGPRTVSEGEKFSYHITIKNTSKSTDNVVFLYYTPPQELEFVACTTSSKKYFSLDYSDEFNSVYGEGHDLQSDQRIDLVITLRARKRLELRSDRKLVQDSASYFSFLVEKDKIEVEVSQRKALTILPLKNDLQ